MKQFYARGDLIRCERDRRSRANVVRRILRDYFAGISPRVIAKTLNEQGVVSGPEGWLWNDTTIHGHAKRGAGILNNELYIGRLIWNRLRYLKDPSTGKRVSPGIRMDRKGRSRSAYCR